MDLCKFNTFYQEADDEEDKIYARNFVSVFETQSFKDTNEQQGQTSSLFWKDIGRRGVPNNMFTRSSNWEKNLERADTKFDSDEPRHYSVRYLIGGNYISYYHQYGEIKEYLITYDIKEASFDNSD